MDFAEEDPPLSDATVIMTTARAAPRDWVHCLVVVEGDEPGRRIAIGDAPLRIGRRAGLEFLVSDPQVSGWHCTVRAQPAALDLLVTDEHSSNGTFIEGQRIVGAADLPRGGLLQIGRLLLRHDHVLRRELEAAEELQRDLAKARAYVESLLPPPVAVGPIRVEWVFQPSADLGGDAFGYQRLADGRFIVYLLDVSGHGVGAAMHSVVVLNQLRQLVAPGAEAAQPGVVLARLNSLLPMAQHAGMYFSIWYGVFDPQARVLRYASAGHHPAYLHAPGLAEPRPLRTRNPIIGALPAHEFSEAELPLPEGARLLVFSDGVFEITGPDGADWGLEQLRPLINRLPLEQPAAARALFDAVRAAARPGPLQDDASIVAVTFL